VKKKQSLKKFFLLLGLWFVTILTVLAGSIIYKQNQSSEYHDRAVPYINKVIPEISKWDPATTRALMAPEVAATIPEENFTKAMNWFSRLGKLQNIEEPSFVKAHVDQETDIGKLTIIEYDIDARYENDDAEIHLKLLEKNGSFEIYRFNFSAEILTEQQQNQ
jgi:hypothetical protein